MGTGCLARIPHVCAEPSPEPRRRDSFLRGHNPIENQVSDVFREIHAAVEEAPHPDEPELV